MSIGRVLSRWRRLLPNNGRGGGRSGGGLGRWPTCWTSWQLSGATTRHSGPTTRCFFGAWRSYFVPLYGLITLGANFAFNEQKYRLYNLLCNTRIEEETFRLPLNFNRKRQIRTVEWGAIGAPSDSCPEECVDVSQTGINFPKCRLDPWCQPSNADN